MATKKIEYRKVVMTNVTADFTFSATDYVSVKDLDSYKKDAESRWQSVEDFDDDREGAE